MEIHLNDDRIKLLRDLHFPFSMIGRCDELKNLGYVDINFKQTMVDAVNYLVTLGHSHIAFLNHSQVEFDAGYGPAVRAQADFIQATQTAGIQGVTRFCGATPSAGYEALNDLLVESPDLTAMIAMNDRAVPGVLLALTEKGRCVPNDFSLIAAVSSARAAEMVMPALTTMDPPSAELGRLGVELLIEQLEDQEEDLRQVLLPCRLVVRGSTGAYQPKRIAK
jgi:DNA-binding LacI/PurR family transcriptional regulator